MIPADLLDQLLAGTDAATALDQGGLLDSLKKALAERVLGAEMDYDLGHDEQDGNSRDGYGRKTVITDTGKIASIHPAGLRRLSIAHKSAGKFDTELDIHEARPAAPNNHVAGRRVVASREIPAQTGDFAQIIR